MRHYIAIPPEPENPGAHWANRELALLARLCLFTNDLGLL